jgi:hypothetical protein
MANIGHSIPSCDDACVTDATGIAALCVAAISGAASVYAVTISRRALRWEQNRVKPNVDVRFGHVMQLAMKAGPGSKFSSSYTARVNVINLGETTEFIHMLRLEDPVTGREWTIPRLPIRNSNLMLGGQQR